MFVPLATSLECRDSSLTKDAKLVNCFVEQTSNGAFVVKRPGLDSAINSPTVEGDTQGAFSFNGLPFFVNGNKLYFFGQGTEVITLPSPSGEDQISFASLEFNSDPLFPTNSGPVLLGTFGDLWKLSSESGVTTITKVTTPFLPTAVPGLVYMDGTAYRLTPDGELRGSGLEDPFTWDPLNFLKVDPALGFSVRLVRHLNYVVALCSKGIQMFYDAGNPGPGSPLAPSGNTIVDVGCASAWSVVNLDNHLIFVSRGPSFSASVSMFTGLALSTVSTPSIDRILGSTSGAYIHAFGFHSAGHSFYVLNLWINEITLVLDIGTGIWSQWTSPRAGVSGKRFLGEFFVDDFLVSSSPSRGYVVQPSIYQDVSAPIQCLIRTRILDHDSMSRKFLPVINLVGDANSGNVSVRYSDDDYTTFSSYRTVDMASRRRQLTRLGSFYRRSFDILHTGNAPMRMEALSIPDSAAPGQAAPSSE